MTDSLDSLIARRMGGSRFPEDRDGYKFGLIKKAREEAALARPEQRILDFGVGEPDEGADPVITETLIRECSRRENRFYADGGIGEFKRAALSYLERVYAVKGLTEENILHGIGSKAILAKLPACYIDPGDVTLMTVPGYGVMGTHTEYLGGRVHPCPLTRENDFYPDLDRIPDNILKPTKLLYLNYPNNPTGQTGTGEFFQKALDFAERNNLLIVHDAAYGDLNYGGEPLSILSLPGALERAVEVHSLSKAFNMTGWRMAFLAGSPRAVALYGAVKDNSDSGQFRPIQLAAARALSRPDLTAAYREKYERRLRLLVETLRECGWDARMPRGTFYCYVPVPSGTAREWANRLIGEAGIVAVPWDEAGAYL
ncbi:MAG: aminotransferase class I/II-fold pyridoxal phosphate-dependent enzyme, partial [Spirochaetales bacterium]|nr:aminotransferase class I/II-fold pyridoxal phosphate-dependent enzyme [Spirochaetales bacterium]